MSDLISRQAAIDSLCSVCGVDCNKQADQVVLCPVYYALNQLPSAQPEPSQVARDIATILENEKDMRVILANNTDRKTGRWIVMETAYEDTVAKCPERGFETLVNEPGNGFHFLSDLHYCPSCGLPMEVEHENRMED